ITATVAAVESVVNLGCSIALAKPLGPAGVALGTAIGLVCVGLPCSLVLAGRLTGVRARTFLHRSLLPQVLPTVVVGLFLLVAVRVLPEDRILTLAVAAAGFFAYLALYVVVTPAPEERARARKAIRLLGRGPLRRVRPAASAD